MRRFVYDGDALIAEYSSNGSQLYRYVHGIGTDNPLIQYAGNGTANTNRHYLLNNHQGSVIADVTYTGALSTKNRYDEYGVPDPANQGRFGYTGQLYLKEIGLYHYKARVYHPRLGRFLQTDPVGYEDQMNLYAYVGNDPANHTDPSGKIIDTIADIGFIAYDLYTIAVEGATETNLAALGADLIGAAVPGATGLGAGVRSAARAEELSKNVAKGAGKLNPKLIQENPRNLIPTQTKSEMSGSQVKRLTKDMKQNGFDQSKPVDVWRNTNTGRLEIQDGHHRTEAAKKADLDKIPVQVWD